MGTTIDQMGLRSKILDLEAELTKAKKRNKLFPGYLAGLSHDIRTPLNAILGFASLLSDPELSLEERLMYSNMITRSSKRLLTTITNLIDLAKIETNDLKLFVEDIPLSGLFEDLKDEFSQDLAIYEKNNLDISFQTPFNGSGKIRTDRARLQQILKILLDNSLRFTKQGSIKLVAAINPFNQAIFQVIDTGKGMDKETLDTLFDIFPRSMVEPGKKVNSRGLGVLVVKRLVEMMNGKILIQSEKSKGTTVSIELPTTPLKES